MGELREHIPSTSINLGALIFIILLALKLTGATTLSWALVFLIPLIPFMLVLAGLVMVPILALIAFLIAVLFDIWTRKS